MTVALQKKISLTEWKELLANYIRKNFTSDGMCADVSIHDTDSHNPYAHIVLTVRPLEQEGTWQYKTKKEYLRVRNGEERGSTAEEWKQAQREGWEKQYAYKPEKGKKNIYLPPSEAERRGNESFHHRVGEKVQQRIPEIARLLETVRDNLIIIQYQLMFNHAQLTGIQDFKKQKKPLLDKIKKVRAGIREKTAEHKKLQTEKKKLLVWKL